MNTQNVAQNLKNKLTTWFDDFKTSPRVGFGANSYADVKGQVFDDLVGEFMRETWGQDWSENDEAQTFYENKACDLRGDAENDMQEWIDENGEFDEQVVITGIYAEDMGDFHLVEVRYRTFESESQEIYFNLDGSETGDDETRLARIVKNCFTEENQAQFDAVVEQITFEKVLGFIPVAQDGDVIAKSIFGCSLADYGVYQYMSGKGEYAVAVHKYCEDLSYEDKAKSFNSIDELDSWYSDMMQDDAYNDASAVNRAINDIQGVEEY